MQEIEQVSLPEGNEPKPVLGSPLIVRGKEPEKLQGFPLRPACMEADSSDAYKEEYLQEIVDSCPSVLPIRDFYPGSKSVCSLGREVPVPVARDQEGSIDNLLIADDGHLIVVETKLRRNHESTRDVVAQCLQYGMAVSQLDLEDFENRIRRAGLGQRLQNGETVATRARRLLEIDDDFEDRFDVLRRREEILILVVADGIRHSAERLVGWINEIAGSSPIRVGLVELKMFDISDDERIVVPRTLLRIREASRHVVAIELRNGVREQIQARVSGDAEGPRTHKTVPPGPPITEEMLLQRVRAVRSTHAAEVASKLLDRLRASGLAERRLPSTIQFGVNVSGEFFALLSLDSWNVWFQIPRRAARALGDQAFVSCKQRINKVVAFYRSEDVGDPERATTIAAAYANLEGRIEPLVSAVMEIVPELRGAMEHAGS